MLVPGRGLSDELCRDRRHCDQRRESPLRLAWHALPWLAPLPLLSELEAHVQQG